jgi:Zn-dependent membrane protease YugP
MVLVFHVVTLPVEFDAIKRTDKYLRKNDILSKKELEDASVLFKVSPYTFIMSIITCISTLVSELMYNIQRRG